MARLRTLWCLVGACLVIGDVLAEEATAGLALYDRHCAQCHSLESDMRTPSRFQLTRMNPLAMLTSLESGRMQPQAEALTGLEKRLLVEALTGRAIAELTLDESAFCAARQVPHLSDSPVHWSGWGGAITGSGYAPGLGIDDVPKLRLKWALGFPGVTQARSQPAVVGNALFVGSAEGAVYAVNATTGCIHWRLPTIAAVRGAIEVGPTRRGERVLYFADSATNVYAVEASTGTVIWQVPVRQERLSRITGTPVYHDGRVYVPISSAEVGAAGNPEYECCTSSGGVAALDSATGKVLWRMRTTLTEARAVGTSANGKRIFAPSGAPVWASPTVDAKRGLLYIGTGENYTRPATTTSDAVIALSLATGEVVWSFQATLDDAWHGGCRRMPETPPCDAPGPDLDFGMSPIIATGADGRQVLLVGQKSGVVHAFDPDDGGALLWQTRVGKGSALGGIHWGMATDGERVFVTNADRPAIINDVNPEVALSPGTYALDVASGALRWKQATPGEACEVLTMNESRARGQLARCLTANSAAPSVSDAVIFAGDLNGTLRAYATADGRVLWEYDTAREFETTNGVSATGGSIDGPGPVIANRMLFVNSGYGSFGQIAGNVLLAFDVE